MNDLRLLERVDPTQIGLLIAEIFGLLVLYRLSRMRVDLTGRLLQFVMIVFCLRFVLFSTPLSWGAVFLFEKQPDIDWREADVAANKVKRYLVPRAAHPFVVVGSSQTWAIYSAFAKTHSQIEPYFLAGMGPIDFVEEYDRIRSIKPGRIVLFLSEFDLARPIVTTAVPLSTLPVSQYGRFYSALKAALSADDARSVVTEKAISDAFPEYRYRFIANGAVKRLERFLPTPRSAPSRPVDKNQALSLEGLDARYVGPQISLLKAFLDRCRSDTIPVTIIEGQYNPQAYSAKNMQLHNAVIIPALQRLTTQYDNVAFLRRSDTGEFDTASYGDLYHVKPAPAAVFATRVLAKLETESRRGSRR